MLRGTADVAELAVGAPEIPAFLKEDVELRDVTCFQLTAEMHANARESQVPPALHPTIPAALSVQVYDVGESDCGSFRFATVRVSCRSGVRARGFTRGTIVDGDDACAGLRDGLGFPARPGEVRFRHGYDGVSIEVRDGDSPVLGVEGIDPEPMGLDDVQYTGTLNLAQTPLGLRLMQVEMSPQTSQVERLTARLTAFDGKAWGDERLVPSLVIAASVVRMDLTFPPVRFVCSTEELAFTGTEPVS